MREKGVKVKLLPVTDVLVDIIAPSKNLDENFELGAVEVWRNGSVLEYLLSLVLTAFTC